MDKYELKELKENLLLSIKNLSLKDFTGGNLDNILLYDSDDFQLSLGIK